MRPASSMVRRSLPGAIALGLALATGACSVFSDEGADAVPTENVDGADASSEAPPSEEETPTEASDDPSSEAPQQAAAGPAVIQVAIQPGTADDDFEGARADVPDFTCAQAGDAWQVSGTVVNSSTQTVDYRIYVALLNADNDTRGLLQVDVVDVASGDEEPWEAEVGLADVDLDCVLRVERVTG